MKKLKKIIHSTKNLLKKKKFKELSDLFDANVNGFWREKFRFKPNASFAHATFVLKEICH